MHLFHVSVLSVGSLRIFPDPASRLRAIRRLIAFLGARLLWFGFADNHLHLVIEADPARVRVIARDIGCLLARNGAIGFRPPFVQPIENLRHLENCWPYVLGNAEVHKLDPGGAWLDASSVPDLVGARVIPGFDPDRWRVHLPRRTLGEMLRRLGLSVPEPVPVADLRAVGATRIARAAAAAAGWPDLSSNQPEVVRARTAAAHLSVAAGIAAAEVAHALDVDARIVRRLRSRPAMPAFELAVRIRITLDSPRT